MTAPQAGQIVSRSRISVFSWVDEGKLPAMRITDRKIILIDVADLRAFAAQHGLSFDEELAAELGMQHE